VTKGWGARSCARTCCSGSRRPDGGEGHRFDMMADLGPRRMPDPW
jgi:hypothetical protein